ncbi:hypothetical protein DAMA08_004820 [Martiniozyma asiatica (nom. inval.)]|nr:hypothetical protein DAMA08_004820 [Martiniozyma asiatica]
MSANANTPELVTLDIQGEDICNFEDLDSPQSNAYLRGPSPYLERTQQLDEQEEYLRKMNIYGYLIIFISWLLFVISIGFIFNLWGWVFEDGFDIRPLFEGTILETLVDDYYSQETVIDNYYLFAFFLMFVVLWIWAVGSWISMKLFRHSKGGGT